DQPAEPTAEKRGQPASSRELDDAGSVTAPPLDQSAAVQLSSTPNHGPPVAAVAAPAQPLVERASTPAPEPGPTSAATGIQRSRLPAGMLAQGTGETNRRAPTDVDTARLLARVARAFTAVQVR